MSRTVFFFDHVQEIFKLLVAMISLVTHGGQNLELDFTKATGNTTGNIWENVQFEKYVVYEIMIMGHQAEVSSHSKML